MSLVGGEKSELHPLFHFIIDAPSRNGLTALFELEHCETAVAIPMAAGTTT